MMKGLPLSYNRDMQLDKPGLFSSLEIVEKGLKVLPGLIGTLKINKKAMAASLAGNEAIYATDMVYHLVDKGVPFKSAHDAVGKLIVYSINTGRKLADMTDSELHVFSPALDNRSVRAIMDPAISVRSRVSVRNK
jgi:argininosuccinate lyase